MKFVCKGCEGKHDKPIPSGICHFHSLGKLPHPKGCLYFYAGARVKWKQE